MVCKCINFFFFALCHACVHRKHSYHTIMIKIQHFSFLEMVCNVLNFTQGNFSCVILSSSIFSKGTLCPVRLFTFSILATDYPE